jgi:pyruvate/2-oxoglutarate dehydrogenase complex dihydrolipoamide acyltransferase (E2) component
VSLTGPDSDAVRAVIREVLAELLPPAGSPGPSKPTAAQPAPGRPVPAPQPVPVHAGPAQPGLAYPVSEDAQSVETVSLRTDADLGAFVRRLLHLFENPKHRDELRSGRLRFRLAPVAAPGSAQPAHRVEKGAVTEAMVAEAAKAGARLVLGRRAVLTPLARDRARAAGVEIERER